MARINQLIFKGVVNLTIKRLDCTESATLGILDLFEYENAIVEIGNIEKDCSLFQAIKELSIHHEILAPDSSQYADAVLMLNAQNFRKLLHCIFSTECESFCVNLIKNGDAWDRVLQGEIAKWQLVRRETIAVSIVVEIDEALMDILFSERLYDAKCVMLRIKDQIGKSRRPEK